MRFTVLVENERGETALEAEHGISLWIETGDMRVLFDTGASSAFAENAAVLGVPLETADALVLSHAHADHTGGLHTFFARNASAPVFVGPGIDTPRYAVDGDRRRAIGIDADFLGEHADRFREVSDSVELAPGVGVSRILRRPHPVPKGNDRLLREQHGRLERDPFEEELFLWVVEGDGVRVVTGCSHSGIANIVDAAGAYGSVHAVIGGFHLKDEEESILREVARMLSGVGSIYTGHCTGRRGYEFLRGRLGPRVQYASTGTRATV
ncbi:MAG: MBL fold metallo-hydrolase [Spirochaetaceae bacterium]